MNSNTSNAGCRTFVRSAAPANCLSRTLETRATIPATNQPDNKLRTFYAEFGNSEVESLVTINGNVGVSNDGFSIRGRFFQERGASGFVPKTCHGRD